MAIPMVWVGSPAAVDSNSLLTPWMLYSCDCPLFAHMFVLVLSESSQSDASFRMRRQPSKADETASLRARAETPRCPQFRMNRRMNTLNERLEMSPGAAKLVGHWGKSGPGSVNHTGVPEKNLKATAAAAAHPRAIHRPCTLCETQAHCQESPHHSRATAACRLEQPGTKPAHTSSAGPGTAPLS